MCLHLWVTFRMHSAALEQGSREKRKRIFQAEGTGYVRALKEDGHFSNGKPDKLPD